ncbi:MAG: hypothetical protein E7263_06085 [Lachnospiraceae bacterium]|nr:hypothetical protein [Lachnospiraceae bacterium]
MILLSEEYLWSIPDSVVKIWEELEEWLIKDICERIMAAELYDYDKIPGIAQWRIKLLSEAGMHYNDLISVISKVTRKSEAEVKKLFEESGLEGLMNEAKMFERQGIEPLQLMESSVLKTILQDCYNRTNGELRNFTRTTANASQKLLIDTLDKAYFDVTTGARSYSEVIREAVDTVGKQSGVVLYNSGHRDTIETAVRRSVLTGINQGAGKISIANAKELGAEYVVVSAHPGARTSEDPIADHSGWQGKIYKIEGEDQYPNLEKSTGFPNNPLGLCGYNCRHSIHAYFLGEPNPFEDVVKDKKASDKLYDLSQKQRQQERSIRKTKKQLMAYETAIENCKDEQAKFELQMEYDKLAAKLQKQNKRYKDFCKENEEYGIKSEQERLRTLNWKRENADKARSGANRHNDAKEIKNPKNMIFFEENTIERSQNVHKMLNEYCTRESKWSGKTIIDAEKCIKEKFAGKKEWSCDIITYEGVQTKTLIHEHLHARSSSHRSKEEYLMYQRIEEGSVELFAQEICKDKGFVFFPSYEKLVDTLRDINSQIKLYDNDLDFAKALFDVDMTYRWRWLSDKVDEYAKLNGLNSKEIIELRKPINTLYGGI